MDHLSPENISAALVPLQWLLWLGGSVTSVLFLFVAMILKDLMGQFKTVKGDVKTLTENLAAHATQSAARFEERTNVSNSFARVHERLDDITKDFNSRIDSQTAAISTQISNVQTNLISVVSKGAH